MIPQVRIYLAFGEFGNAFQKGQLAIEASSTLEEMELAKSLFEKVVAARCEAKALEFEGTEDAETIRNTVGEAAWNEIMARMTETEAEANGAQEDPDENQDHEGMSAYEVSFLVNTLPPLAPELELNETLSRYLAFPMALEKPM